MWEVLKETRLKFQHLKGVAKRATNTNLGTYQHQKPKISITE
jgi:hypothetical protein